MYNNREGMNNPELSALPQNPLEYPGDFVSPVEGKSKESSAAQLLEIVNLVEQRQGN